MPFDEGLRKVALDQTEEPLRLAPVEPDDGGDVFLLLRAEVEDGACDLAVDIARVEHQDTVAPGLIPLLRTIKEPELAGDGSRVEEVAADVDHHVHRSALNQLLPHLCLVPPGAGCLRRHHEAGAPVLVEVTVEVLNPQIVCVENLLRLVHSGQAKRQTFFALDLLCVDLVHVEGWIGHDEVALSSQFVRVIIVSDCFISGLELSLQSVDSEVDLG